MKELNTHNYDDNKNRIKRFFSKNLDMLIILFFIIIIISTFFSKTIYNIILPEVRKAEIIQGDVKKSIMVDGRYKLEINEINSIVNSKINKVIVKKGDYIKKGDVIADFDILEFEKSYNEIFSKYNNIKKQYIEYSSKSIDSITKEKKKIFLMKEKDLKSGMKELDKLTNSKEEDILYNTYYDLNSKKIVLDVVTKNYERNKHLFEQGVISRTSLEVIEKQYKDAENNYFLVEKKLEEEKSNIIIRKYSAESNVLRLQNDLEQAKRDYNNIKEEYTLTLNGLKAGYEAANLEIEQLKQIKKNNYQIRSDYEGKITDVYIKNGQYITKNESILSIGFDNSYTIEGYANASDITDINVGDAVDLYITKYINKSIKGKVSSVGGAVEEIQGNGDFVEIRVKIDEDLDEVAMKNISSKLPHNEKIEINILKTKYCNKMVPNSAIVYEYNEKTRNTEKYAYKIRSMTNLFGKEHYAEKVRIITGFEGDMFIEIVQGLENSDDIILNPSNEVNDGERVFLYE